MVEIKRIFKNIFCELWIFLIFSSVNFNLILLPERNILSSALVTNKAGSVLANRFIEYSQVVTTICSYTLKITVIITHK
jgi:hypothetical protein